MCLKRYNAVRDKTKINAEIKRKAYNQVFDSNKMKVCVSQTEECSLDPLFFCPKKKNPNTSRWILAIKFFISLNIKLEYHNVFGLDISQIPQNMFFFIDNQNNICAIIYHSMPTDYNPAKIIQHCTKMDLVLMERYKTKEKNEVDIIRVPVSYYNQFMKHSFYEYCCKLIRYLLDKNDTSNPLFLLFLRNIANFDCFQKSVPLMPLSGCLESMFNQFAFGIYDWDKTKKTIYKLSKNEFKSFLGCYHSWFEINQNKKIQKYLCEIWDNISYGNSLSILHDILEYADIYVILKEKVILNNITNFANDKSEIYQNYYNQLYVASNGDLESFISL